MFATQQNRGDILVKLKPRSERDKDVNEIIADERDRFAKEAPGMTIEFVQILQDMLGDLEGTPEPVEVKLFGDDLPTLETLTTRIAEKMEKVPGLVDLVVAAARQPGARGAGSIRRAPPKPASRRSRCRPSSPAACSATSRPRSAAAIG